MLYHVWSKMLGKKKKKKSESQFEWNWMHATFLNYRTFVWYFIQKVTSPRCEMISWELIAATTTESGFQGLTTTTSHFGWWVPSQYDWWVLTGYQVIYIYIYIYRLLGWYHATLSHVGKLKLKRRGLLVEEVRWFYWFSVFFMVFFK